MTLKAQIAAVESLIPDASALAFLRHLNLLVNVWDDLIDQDKAITPEQINAAFLAAMVEIPRNTFYQQWRHELQPVIDSSIADWLASVKFERSGNPELVARAHVLRFNGLQVWVMCARILGGIEHAIRAAEILREAIPAETLSEYTRECKCDTPTP